MPADCVLINLKESSFASSPPLVGELLRRMAAM